MWIKIISPFNKIFFIATMGFDEWACILYILFRCIIMSLLDIMMRNYVDCAIFVSSGLGKMIMAVYKAN